MIADASTSPGSRKLRANGPWRRSTRWKASGRLPAAGRRSPRTTISSAVGVHREVLRRRRRAAPARDVGVVRLEHVGDRHPAAVQRGGVVEPLAAQRLVEQPVHPLLQVEHLLAEGPVAGAWD